MITFDGLNDFLRTDWVITITGMRMLHRYHTITCPCGIETAARPGRGEVSTLNGRQRQLRPSEAGLVGPGLTTFIAALSVRYRLSRAKIAELLATWCDVRLSVGSIDRCIREAGLACVPMVEGLLANLRAARFGDWLVREMRGLIHAVSEKAGARTLNPILARLKRACRLNQNAEAAKARALTCEVLAD